MEIRCRKSGVSEIRCRSIILAREIRCRSIISCPRKSGVGPSFLPAEIRCHAEIRCQSMEIRCQSIILARKDAKR